MCASLTAICVAPMCKTPQIKLLLQTGVNRGGVLPRYILLLTLLVQKYVFSTGVRIEKCKVE